MPSHIQALRVFWIGGNFFLNRAGRRLQLVEMKMSKSEEEVGAMQAGFQAKRFLQAGDRFLVAALLFTYETKIKVGFGEGRHGLGDGGETFPRFLKVSTSHGFGGLAKLIVDSRASLRA
jgi:hypothetical protein